MSTAAIVGGTLAACLASVFGGRAWLRRRAEVRREDERRGSELDRLDRRGREVAAHEAALHDAAQAVARLESALTRREAALSRTEEDLYERTRTFLRRERSLERESSRLRAGEGELERRLASVADLEAELGAVREELQHRLAVVSGLEPAEAMAQLLDELDSELAAERERRVRASVEGARRDASQKARDIVITAIQRMGMEECAEATQTRVPLPSDELKGRIIGREGRNVRALEAATGCDVIVDETPGVVVVSCFDGVRREVARRALERLIQEGRIQPGRIEEVVEEAQARVEQDLPEAGRQAAAKVGVAELHPEVQAYLGRLRYRTSYGQSVLAHSVEVAHLSGMMAAELGLDASLARRAGLLHDLGKAMDHQLEGGHDQVAARVLRGFGEREAVVRCIEMHHEDGDRLDPYAALVQVSDAISAARPGARRQNVQRYVERIQELESLAASFPGVTQAYAVHAGREVRVLVDAGEVGDEESTHLAWQIARKIEQDLAWRADVRVTLIRELRVTDTARSGGTA